MFDVGRHCVVGAGSVVTRKVPNYAIVVGSPAHLVRYRGGQAAEVPVFPTVNAPIEPNFQGD